MKKAFKQIGMALAEGVYRIFVAYYLNTGKMPRLLRECWMWSGARLQSKLNAAHGTKIDYIGMF